MFVVENINGLKGERFSLADTLRGIEEIIV
jgi:hypothetical protein